MNGLVLVIFNGLGQDLQALVGLISFLLGFTGFSWVGIGVTGFYLVLLGFSWVVICFV